jgi:hypothetical protein
VCERKESKRDEYVVRTFRERYRDVGPEVRSRSGENLAILNQATVIVGAENGPRAPQGIRTTAKNFVRTHVTKSVIDARTAKLISGGPSTLLYRWILSAV